MQLILSLLLLLSFLSPILGYLTFLALQRTQIRRGFLWLTAFCGFAISWLIILIMRFFLPVNYSFPMWQPEAIFPLPIAFVLDGFTWPFAIAITTLGLGFIFSETSSGDDEFDVSGWGYGLMVIGLGLAAILAANQVTLLLAWAGLDLVELFIWLSRSQQQVLREKVVLAFASRATGIMISLWGAGNVNIYFIAVILRLGIIPFHLPYLEGTVMRRGLGTLFRIVPAVTTYPFLVNLAFYPEIQVSAGVLPILVMLALFAGILWVSGRNELEARPFWIIVTSVMVLIATVHRSAEAVIAWGLIMALIGGILFLGRFRNHFWSVIYSIQVMILSGLAFSPMWDVVRVYSPSISFLNIMLFLSHCLLVGGFVRYVLEKPRQPLEGEQWIKLMYSIGLLLLFLIQCLTGYGNWPHLLSLGTEYQYPTTKTFVEFSVGFVLLISLGVLLVIRRFNIFQLSLANSPFYQILSLEWMFPLAQWIFRNTASVIMSIYSIFEGEGGIIWTILLVVLLSGFILFFTTGG